MALTASRRYGSDYDDERMPAAATAFAFAEPVYVSREAVHAQPATTPVAAAEYGEAGATSGGKASGGAISGTAGASVIGVARESYIARGNTLYNMGSMFNVNGAASGAPASLTLTVYDRNNYAGAETYNYGTVSATDGEYYKSGGLNITFTLKNGVYSTANGMKLSDFTFSASTQEDRVANINLAAYDSRGSLMSQRNVSVVTHATTTDATAGRSSAAEIAKVAQSFIGKTWDASGCWVLACDIAATAGGSLTFNSGWITSQVANNGQWTVAYSAYNGVNSSWMKNLQAGDIVEVGWTGYNFGHIFTIDRVVNGTAYLVDNGGSYVKGGDPNDVTITEKAITAYAPYIDQKTVIVYRDNGVLPTFANATATVLTTPFTNVTVGKTIAAASLFRATDADYNAISQYQIRDNGANGYFSLNGAKQAAGQWITVSATQLSQLTYTACANGSCSDTFEVKAYDGQAWGNSATGRIVSLWDQTNQNDEKKIRSFGAVDQAGYATKATEWVGSSDKYDWFTFTIAKQATTVDIQLANLTGQVNMWVMDSKGGLVGSAYGYAYNSRACELVGTLGIGTYTVRIDQYLGNTDYDLTIGKLGTVAGVQSGGTTQMIYASNYLKAAGGTQTATTAGTQTNGRAAGDATFFAEFDPMNGTAPSLALADSLGLGDGYASATLPAADGQDPNRQLLAQA